MFCKYRTTSFDLRMLLTNFGYGNKGSWTQVAVQRTNSNMTIAEKPQGTVIAVDRDDLQKLDGAHILAFSDITHQKTIEKIEKLLNNRKVNSVISDMVFTDWYIMQLKL